MTNPTNTYTNTYTVPSVSITTARTGAAAKANALGMRAMQKRLCQDGGSQAPRAPTLLRNRLQVIVLRDEGEAVFVREFSEDVLLGVGSTRCVFLQPALNII